MKTQCCYCHKVFSFSGRWRRVRNPVEVARQAKHTFCPKCETEFRKRHGL